MINEVTKDPKDAPTKVRVKAPFRVVHETTAYAGGDEVTVPQHLADQWLRSRWVEPVTTIVKEK